MAVTGRQLEVAAGEHPVEIVSGIAEVGEGAPAIRAVMGGTAGSELEQRKHSPAAQNLVGGFAGLSHPGQTR